MPVGLKVTNQNIVSNSAIKNVQYGFSAVQFQVPMIFLFRQSIRLLGFMCASLAMSAPLNSSFVLAATHSGVCPQNQRAYLNIDTNLPGLSSGQAELLSAQIRDAIQNNGLVFIDPELAGAALEKRQQALVAMGDAVGALELARELEATLLVRSTLNGRQRPIRGLAQGLYNVTLQLDIQLLSATSGQVLSHAQQQIRKAGLDLEAQAADLLDKLLADTASGLVSELCRKLGSGQASAEPSKPEPKATGATASEPSPLDSL